MYPTFSRKEKHPRPSLIVGFENPTYGLRGNDCGAGRPGIDARRTNTGKLKNIGHKCPTY
ncbi:hypothetical protein HMPREF9123_1204 [Neisseria bacilliformis ATCC BAA-1200]|uniref:Uncharacterized protein n=1 Tax=Neisseria bacilliformis ATCC BAA-1200 TaxID=888742 RepID=F2BBU9_9NEIS|nr:hypothetical protein HMPREF9123_1204 [Neisseria bacilliformis ATCC BAA-1200]